MAVGYLSGSVCHASLSGAADAYFSSGVPSLASGSTAYSAWFEKSGADWVLHRQSITGGVVTDLGSTVQQVPAFAQCDPQEQFFDGLAMGWLVAGLMVSAWCWLYIRRAAK